MNEKHPAPSDAAPASWSAPRPVHAGFVKLGAFSVAAALSLPCLHAASGDWNVDAAGNWSDSANWTPGVADGSGSIAALTFNITGDRLVTLDSSRSIGVLNIGDTNGSNIYTLATGVNTLTLDNGVADAQLNQVSTSKGDTVSGLLAIGGNGNLTVTNAAAGKTLTISAGISSVLASGTQMLTFNNGNAVTASGVIANGVAGGTIAVVKSGAGTLTLGSVANTFTGGLTIKSGTVTGGANANSFGANTSAITLGDSTGGSSNATLTGGGATYANPITVASTNTGTATITNSANSIFNGAITLNSHDLSVTVAGFFNTLTLNGMVTGTGNLLLASSGVSASNRLVVTGGVNIVGTITNTGAGNPSNGNLISGSIGSNVTAITQDSATAALSLSGNNSAYANGITIKKGTLSAAGSNSLGASANVITLGDSTGSSSTTLLGSGAAGTITNSIQVAAGNTGTAQISSTFSNTGSFSGLITLNSHDLTVSAPYGAMSFSGGFASTGTGGSLTINSSGTNTLTISGATVNNAGSITHIGSSTGSSLISAVIGSNVTGVSQNSSTSTLTLGGVNTYSGPTTVMLGTLATNATGTFGSSDVTVASGAKLTLGNAASFGDLAQLVFASTSTAGSITLNFTGADTLGSVYDSVSATYLAGGTYTAGQLNTYFSSSVFAGTGSFTVSAIPEPATCALLGGVFALMIAFRCSRKRR